MLNQAVMPHCSFGIGTLVHFLSDWHKEPLTIGNRIFNG